MNRELLERTMQYIEDHPEEHYQGMWFKKTECGTAACFAGWACLLSGYEPDFERSGSLWDGKSAFHVKNGAFAQDEAIRLLGISGEDAETLFDPENTLDGLKLMVKDLVNGEHLKEPGEYH